MDRIRYFEGVYHLQFGSEGTVQNCFCCLHWLSYLQATQPPALPCELLTGSAYNEVIITLQWSGVNAGQMACILLTEIGSQVKYMLGVSEQIQKKIRGTKKCDWRGKIPLGVNRAEMYQRM